VAPSRRKRRQVAIGRTADALHVDRHLVATSASRSIFGLRSDADEERGEASALASNQACRSGASSCCGHPNQQTTQRLAERRRALADAVASGLRDAA
jgi:hypothetical protein